MFVNKILRYIFYFPFRLFTSLDVIPFEPLKHLKLDKTKPIAYVLVSSSLGNMLAVERLTQKLNLPSPFEDLKIGDDTLRRVVYLRTPRLFSSKIKRRDVSPIIDKWYNACKKNNTDIQLIPITVLWSRNPSYEGLAILGVDAPTPSYKKFLTLTFSGRDNCTIISDTFLLKKLYEKYHEKQGRIDKKLLLNRFFAIHFLKNARAVVGKAFPVREKLIAELLKKPGTLAAIEEEHTKTGKSIQDLEKQAYNIFDTMVADTRYPLLRFFNTVTSLLWHRIYHGQTIIGAQRVRDLVKSGHEIIYIPCHRSHMDYILLSFVIFHEGLPIPQVASGDNLNFFPVGPLIRRCGSYFIKRKMKGDKFYTAMFREYLSILFEKGYATEFFIEGGRSRTGRTLPPKTGMVSMTVQAQLRGIERPIAFVPTYLGYEHVMEIGSYMRELDGAHKEKENAWQLFGIFKRFRYYGRGYVTFGDPVIVPRFLSAKVPNWREDIDPSGRNKPAWLYDTVNAMSREIITKLNDSASANGINLCALAIINDDDHTISMRVLRRCISLFVKVLTCDKNRLKSIPNTNVDELIQQALELNKFQSYQVGDMTFLRPSRGQTLQLTYFNNNILHLFALPALIAIILIRNGHIKREEVNVHTRSIFYFLRHELYSPVPESELDSLIEKYIDLYLQEGYITSHDNILYISGDGYAEFSILSRTIRSHLIRYLIGVVALKQTADNTIKVDSLIKRCLILAKKLSPEITNNSPEFADPIMFNILCDTFIRHNYFTINENGTIKPNRAKVFKLATATEPLLAATEVKRLYEQDTTQII